VHINPSGRQTVSRADIEMTEVMVAVTRSRRHHCRNNFYASLKGMRLM
jgi:predicted protein tyrosine phosphatase